MTDLLHATLAIAATFGVYVASLILHRWLGRPSLLHPALVAILAMGGALWGLGIAHEDYFAAAWPIHAALVPMTVLLAVPLYRRRVVIIASAGRLATVVSLGGLVAMLLSAGVAALALAEPEIVRTLVAKSVTTAVAIGISERVGGLTDLLPAIVVATGVWGACVGPSVCRRLRVTDDRAVGLALGIAAHAGGMARAFQLSETAGAYATVGLILNALITAVAVALFMALA